jgi:hypothetical protein
MGLVYFRRSKAGKKGQVRRPCKKGLVRNVNSGCDRNQEGEKL